MQLLAGVSVALAIPMPEVKGTVYTTSQIARMDKPLAYRDWLASYRYDNMHRNFSDCHRCSVKTWEQHLAGKDCESVLALPNYLEVLKERAYDHFLNDVRSQVIQIIRQDGRPPVDITIDPPDVGFRLVRLWLEGIEKPFTFNVSYNY